MDPAEVARQIREMAANGQGGAFVHARMGRRTKYLSDAWIDAARAACKAAKEHGMQIWLYDEDNWPSGYAGGKTLELGDWTRQRYARAVIQSSELPPPAGEIIARFPLHQSDRPSTEDDTLFFVEEYHRGDREFCPEVVANGYVNVFDPAVTREFIKLTHERYKRELAEYWGTTVVGFFFDEPNYHELEWGEPTPRFPWSSQVEERYLAVSGRELRNDLPALYLERPESPLVRWHYYRSLSEQFIEGFTNELYRWCDDNGVELTGHVILEEHPRMAARCIGNPFYHYEASHVPGVDHLGKGIDLPVFWSNAQALCKQVQSAVRQLGRKHALCETFAGGGSNFAVPHQKWQADWMMALGVTKICQHAFHYSERGYRKRDYPPTLSFQQPWFPLSRELADHTGRVSFALTQGERAAEIALLHPMESIWATQENDRFTGEDSLSKAFVLLTDALIKSGYDWDYIDEGYLSRYGEVAESGESPAAANGGRITPLTIGPAAYSVVIVPPAETLRSETVEKLNRFADAGGTIYVTEPEALRVDGLMVPDTELHHAVSLGGWDAPDFYETLLAALATTGAPQILADGALWSDEPNSLGEVVFQWRKVETSNLFFFASAETSPVTHRFLLPCSGTPWLIDTRSGHAVAMEAARPTGGEANAAGEAPAADASSAAGDSEPPPGTRPPRVIEQTGTSVTVELEFDWSRSFLIEVAPTGSPPLLAEVDSRAHTSTLLPGPHTQSRPQSQSQSKTRTLELAGGTSRHAARLDRPNALILDRCEFSVAGQPTAQVLTIDAGSVIRTAAADGETNKRFTARFTAESEISCEAVLGIETPEIFSITWNGTAVPPHATGWHLDTAIKTVALPGGMREGANVLELEAEIAAGVELEPAYILGAFGIELRQTDDGDDATPDREVPVIVPAVTELGVGALWKQGLPFFAGIVEYELEVELPDAPPPSSAMLYLPETTQAVEIHVNGEYAGQLSYHPFALDVREHLRAGDNRIVIRLATTLKNFFGPHHAPYEDEIPCLSPADHFPGDRATAAYRCAAEGLGRVVLITEDGDE